MKINQKDVKKLRVSQIDSKDETFINDMAMRSYSPGRNNGKRKKSTATESAVATKAKKTTKVKGNVEARMKALKHMTLQRLP